MSRSAAGETLWRVGSAESCKDQSKRHDTHTSWRIPPLEYLARLNSHASRQNTKSFHSGSRYTWTSLVFLDVRYVCPYRQCDKILYKDAKHRCEEDEVECTLRQSNWSNRLYMPFCCDFLFARATVMMSSKLCPPHFLPTRETRRRLSNTIISSLHNQNVWKLSRIVAASNFRELAEED